LNSADLNLVQSPGLQKWVQQHTRKRVIGFFNGVHIDRIPSKEEAIEPPGMQGIPVGITVGALGRDKGTYDLLDALSMLVREGRSIRWIFVGRGAVAEFRRLATEKGVGQCVLFTGAVSEEEKWHYLQQADLFCLPSYAEGQPIAILEAMAVGLPVISTSVGSIPEVVRDGESGLIVRPGDCLALAGAVQRLAFDAGLRQRMGTCARAMAQERHDIKLLFDTVRGIYMSLLERKEQALCSSPRG
jgi:glycosyltransferase involved in cell wall biosynthesis